MKQALSIIAAFVLVLGFAVTAEAKKDKGLTGSVVSIASDGASMVIQTGTKKEPGEQVTVMLNSTTTFTLDGQPAKASEIQPGLRVTISPADANATTPATSVAAVTKKKKKDQPAQ